MYRAAEDDVKPVTHWLALDLTQTNGVRLLQQALQYLVCTLFYLKNNVDLCMLTSLTTWHH
jgi:hypothetical protein